MDCIFRLLYSTDGKDWRALHEFPDSDNYWHQARYARNYSERHDGYWRIIRVDMDNLILVTFEKGMPIKLETS